MPNSNTRMVSAMADYSKFVIVVEAIPAFSIKIECSAEQVREIVEGLRRGFPGKSIECIEFPVVYGTEFKVE